jgi:chemotaxis protein MotB
MIGIDMKITAKIFVLGAVAAAFASCVSTKTFNSMRAEALRLDGELTSAKIRVDDLTEQNSKLMAELETLRTEKAQLESQHASLNERYNKLLSDGSAEAARMLRQLEENQRQLTEREERMQELEASLRARDEAIEKIRRQVADALLGFEGKGLSISTREGKVYVSMDDKLLFRSGSFDIDPQGAKAVHDLAVVLAANPDINIMVEGHTDDVPYRPNGNLRDNLDLSVKRATTVTRLLLENKGIVPERIRSAGRGESLPVAEGESAEARARNRRTEIILTPKLDELMRLMDR